MLAKMGNSIIFRSLLALCLLIALCGASTADDTTSSNASATTTSLNSPTKKTSTKASKKHHHIAHKTTKKTKNKSRVKAKHPTSKKTITTIKTKSKKKTVQIHPTEPKATPSVNVNTANISPVTTTPPPIVPLPTTTSVAISPVKPAPTNTPAVPVSRTSSMQDGIDKIIKAFPNLNVGVVVESTATGDVLYQYNANQTFIPASTLKTFTAAAALSYLGPQYVIKTQFLTNAHTLDNGVLHGNLYAKFGGDPDLSIDDLNKMVSDLDAKGIRVIQGSLIIDDHALDQSNWAPGVMWQDEVLCYQAPATSIILNRNCFGYSLGPGPLNQPANVHILPTFANISIFNQTKTTHGECPLNLVEVGHNSYVLSGCISPHHPVISDAVAINNSRQAGTDILLGLLKRHNIEITDGVYYAQASDNFTVLAEHDSTPLGPLVTHMLKKSDDFVSDTLYKKLASVYFNCTGTWANGKQAISSILAQHTGINFNTMTMVDGSGLSRYNAVSPAQLAALLNYAYVSMPNGNVFYQALPIASVDGTLRFRMPAARGRIHAKTGTMKNISGLAGYAETANNKFLTFAILVNSESGNQGTYHMLEDRICQYLALNPW